MANGGRRSGGCLLGGWLDAAPVLVNVSCRCPVVIGGGVLAGGSLGAGLGGRSWIACAPVGGNVSVPVKGHAQVKTHCGQSGCGTNSGH